METSPPASRQHQPQAADVAAGLQRLLALIRWLSPAGLSLTSGATLSTLERIGPCRLTALAVHEGVTQPAMTQLVGRLAEQGLAERRADRADGRVVEVAITSAGRALLASRRAVRTERLSGLLAGLRPEDQDALAAALPAINALASAYSGEQLAGAAS
ncbi:MAG TPA: MarR family transcriptional regulator [Streptosporangiaceae bacterium]|jgi:DNA-binding MarR family transcriptional regulator